MEGLLMGEEVDTTSKTGVTFIQLRSQTGTTIVTGVITFLDVLGWKGIYSRKTNAIHSLMQLVEGVRSQAEEHRGRINGSIEIKSISDTIVIFTPCTEDEVSIAIDIHGALCQWIIPKSIEAEIPVRGAISYGEIEVKENIFVGKAVDEAAAWHEHADWIGVHLTPTAEYFSDIKEDNALWVMFPPPNKTPLRWEAHCVNWTADWQDRLKKTQDIKKKFCKLGPIVPEIAGKYANTLKFIDTIKQPSSQDNV
jgi:hypothetical protein